MSWLLFDYGEVLSLPQPMTDRTRLEEIANHSGAEFWTAYWRPRPEYDRGTLTASEYWSAVLRRRPSPRELRQLIEADVAGWLHLNEETLAAAVRAARRGARLAILSNAPHEVADAIDDATWSAGFAPRLFSCRLHAIKPERAIYSAALDALAASPDDVVFIDDRPENVSAARQMGMRAELFTDAAQVDAITA